MEFHLIKKEAITDEDIIEELRSVMKKLGKSKLTIKEFDANAKINSSTVTRRFGKWNKALSLAGAEISNTFYPSSSGFAIRWLPNIRICNPITHCISLLYIHFTTSTIFSPNAC